MNRTRWRLLAALALAANAMLIPLAALGADSGPPPQPAAVTRAAYYTASATTSLPQVLVHEFPPGVVCIVVPQACPQGLEQIKQTLGINPGIPIPNTPDYQAPQPVLPNTAVRIQPDMAFSKAVTITLPYSKPIPAGKTDSSLLICQATATNGWATLNSTDSTIDPVKQTATDTIMNTNQTRPFAILAIKP